VQEKEFRRVGDQRLQRVDVRFIAASNADLSAAVAAGEFREDLFFRLRVIPVAIPPLRERVDDIEPLARRFVETYATLYRLKPITLADSAARRMAAYAWPGNVRELENCIRYLTCIQLARAVEADDLPLVGPPSRESRSFAEAKREAIAALERDRIGAALRRTNGNVAAAAREEGKARRAFFELMRKHGISADLYRRS
jgi:DNA-binding NtrC family response regulator